MNKKAALELSINAIVIIILAIVLLGLALVFIQDIFKKGAGSVVEIVDVSKLRIPPTSENPIILPDNLAMNVDDDKPAEVGFYCKQSTGCPGTEPFIEQCQSVEQSGTPGFLNSEDLLPTVQGILSQVDPGDSKAFKLIFSPGPDMSGSYICNFVFGIKSSSVKPNGCTAGFSGWGGGADNNFCDKNPICCYAKKSIYLEIGG